VQRMTFTVLFDSFVNCQHALPQTIRWQVQVYC
jgi:hypothetical protein